MTRARPPVVVVGGGAAGLTTALALAPTPVRLLCRAHDGSGTASALAQGGIAAALDPSDSPAMHALDTLTAGAHHNNAAMVQWLCSQAPAAIGWLQAQGVAFDRDADGHLHLGREGGHLAARIVHAGGDASGVALVQALRQRAQQSSHIQWRGDMDVDGLLLRGDAVCGVCTHDTRGHRHEMEAAAVVLATGGIGALYARTSNPPGADGSGLALGMSAGARTRDLEFVQFHPTALNVAGVHCLPLITEALRGAGARLYGATGQLLMADQHPLGDLAPRDVVARRVWQACRDDGSAWLDAREVDGEWERRFPTVLAACLAEGIDPRLQPIPVTPVAHFHMGGIAADADGRTGVPGLYAVGEVACSGVHGANRLASNSLLEGVLCGQRLGLMLATMDLRAASSGPYRWVGRAASLPQSRLEALRMLLWQTAGPEREATGLQNALKACLAWADEGWQARLAQRVLEAALSRTHSLGAHYRTDAVMPA
ncbi:L-aspartate oxidase [Rhodanobacter sp. B04]|uniref:L-aspartate oxidase n=1 Tax=Rhodanobacter sp. B04 TaxID=1945860 RepID=UPI00098501B3|nr:FAD-dependent oxidoreductase [Rhodanobacter sp. B04]OOG65978.1 L-aspartate oxidase [Rhodanobacter sp. B04]